MDHPEDLRKIIQKTAEFVANNGEAVEAKIRELQQNNPKFDFLRQDDLNRPYYDMKLAQYSEAQDVGETELLEPEGNPFFVEQPILATVDMDILKLTAQFLAKNGNNFLVGLSEREPKNPQFDFLKPNHPLFSYFTGLVQAYSRCLLPKLQDITRLQQNIKERGQLLQAALDTYQSEKAATKSQPSKAEFEEEERQQNSLIDWHDFVIVETIEFYEDEILPPPNDKSLVHTLDQGHFDQLKVDTGVVTDIADYTQKCPKCGEMVPINDFAQHMKLELLHPDYKLERAKARVSEIETVLASDAEIAKNLAKIAKHRPDLVNEHAELPIEQSFSFGGKQDDYIPSKLNREESQSPQREASPQGPQLQPVIDHLKRALPFQQKQPQKDSTQEPDYSFIDLKKTPKKVPLLAGPNYSAAPVREKQIYRFHQEIRNSLVPELQWARMHPGNFNVNVRVPEEGGEETWGLKGQVLQVSVHMLSTILALKETLSKVLGGMPVGKIKLKNNFHSVLKDNESLAKYNVAPGSAVDMTLKGRGGRRNN